LTGSTDEELFEVFLIPDDGMADADLLIGGIHDVFAVAGAVQPGGDNLLRGIGIGRTDGVVFAARFRFQADFGKDRVELGAVRTQVG